MRASMIAQQAMSQDRRCMLKDLWWENSPLAIAPGRTSIRAQHQMDLSIALRRFPGA